MAGDTLLPHVNHVRAGRAHRRASLPYTTATGRRGGQGQRALSAFAACGELLRPGYVPARLVESLCVGRGAFAPAGGAPGRLNSDWTCARNLTIALPWI